uniref:Uncharacterized protein n=1 Tax=Spongospora subterranea TaxID=70186 RepID=A0A0H5QLB5_9EUKA|eukprot:CRZ02151.1 hypothetical protein [Spongospora subterranea]
MANPILLNLYVARTTSGLILALALLPRPQFHDCLCLQSCVSPPMSYRSPGIVQPLQPPDFDWPSLSEAALSQCDYFSNAELDPLLNYVDDLYFTKLDRLFIPPTASQLKLRILIVAQLFLARLI